MSKNGNKSAPVIADLFPEPSKDEQLDAEHRLRQYVRIVQRIWKRYEAEDRIDELRQLIEGAQA